MRITNINWFRKLISSETLLRLYKAFILPHFSYCSTVWHFCGSRNSDKLEALNRRILRFILRDRNSTYNQLLDKTKTTSSLYSRRIQNMLLILFKGLYYTNYPGYLKDMFTLRCAAYSLRGTKILNLPRPLTTSYGLHSFKYATAKFWNSLPNNIRTIATLDEFKRTIRQYNFNWDYFLF